MNSTESPATSLLALTNTLQPVVSRCLLGWPVKRSNRYLVQKIAKLMLNNSICQQQMLVLSTPFHNQYSRWALMCMNNVTNTNNQTLAFTGIQSKVCSGPRNQLRINKTLSNKSLSRNKKRTNRVVHLY